MEWALVVAAFVIGLLLGYVGRTLLSRNGNSASSSKLAEQAKLELSQYKQEVNDHVEEHHRQLAELTQTISKLSSQWNDSSAIIAPQNSNKPLAAAEMAASTLEDKPV